MVMVICIDREYRCTVMVQIILILGTETQNLQRDWPVMEHLTIFRGPQTK